MAISLYDMEEVTPVQTIDEIKREKKKEKPEPVSKVRNAKAPPSMGEAFQTFVGDIGAKPAYDTVSNAPAVVKDYLMNPIQYKDGGEQDYTNIDFGATAPRLAADAALAYGGAKGVQYGANKLFPPPGVEVQINQRKDALEQAKRLASGNLNPIERADLEYKKAKTQQLLSSLNPQAPAIPQAGMTPPAQPLAPTVTPTTVPVPSAPTTAPIIPSIQQRSIGQTDAEKAAIEDMKMKATELPGSIQAKYGTTPTKASELVLFANQAPPEMRTNFLPKLLEMMNKGVVPKEAVDAGVTPSTSPPEKETLVASHEASLTPAEKIQEKTNLVQPSSAVQGAVSPRTLPEIAQQPNISPTFQQHLANQQKIVEANPKYQQELTKAYESGRIPKGYVFVPNMGNMDNNIFNTLGPEGRREALAAKGLTSFGQVPEPKDMKYNDVVSKNIADYAQHLRDTIPSVELSTRQERIAKGEPHTTNYGRLVGVPDKEGKFFNKQMKIAGITGGLMAIANLSQAKSIPEFVARGVDVGTDILPLVSQIKQGLSPFEAGAPTLPPGAYSESKKLGSPFHVFPNQGRGIAPPSAYQR
jgi:hypothetical protein